MPALPFRATLPMPLPTTVLRSPQGTLDGLTLRFRVREDAVTVESVATQCSATYWCALGEGCLSYDGEDGDFPQEVPITPGETRALEAFDDVASGWDAAVKAGDRMALRALGVRIRGIAPAQGIRVVVEGA